MRDPVVLTATLPRFLLTGDRGTLQLDLDNVEGAAGDYAIDVTSEGPSSVGGDKRRQLTLAAKQRGARDAAGRRHRRPASATSASASPGRTASRSSAATRSTCGRRRRILTRRTVRPIAKGESITLSNDMFADLVPGTGGVSLSVGALDRARRGGAARTRSTAIRSAARSRSTSRALPLLYVNDLAQRGAARARRRRSTSASATRSTGCWRGRAPTARSACGRRAATTSGSTPMSPTS